MSEERRLVRYNLGMVACQSCGGISEGSHFTGRQVGAAKQALSNCRSYRTPDWHDSTSLANTEAEAEALLDEFRRDYPSCFERFGEEVSHACHGQILFHKYAEFRLALKEEEVLDDFFNMILFMGLERGIKSYPDA
jgi:hypothetical protein